MTRRSEIGDERVDVARPVAEQEQLSQAGVVETHAAVREGGDEAPSSASSRASLLASGRVPTRGA